MAKKVKKMRILIIHNFYDSRINSGENSAVKNEMQLLLEAGHDVTLFSKQNEPHKKMQFSEKFSVGIKFITGRGSKQEFKALLDSKKFDVCHFHNVFPLIGTDVLLEIHNAGIPIVQTIHNYRYRCGAGTNYREGRLCFDCSGHFGALPLISHGCYRNNYIESFGMFFAQRGYQKMMKHISMFIVLSNFSRDALLTFGIESKRIKLKPNFAFRSTLNGSAKPKTIIYSGRLEVDKGLPKLMEAWSQSKASKNEWTLKIAGHGSLFSEVEKFANSAKNVSFLGLLDRKTLLEEIENSRFSIILSEALENLPMVIIESLSVGTPLIVSSNPSLQNFIEKDFTVALPKDFNSWFLTFDQLDSLNYELMSQSSLQEFNEKYSPESSLRALESIYSQVKLLE